MLLTGAGGLIGTALREHLARGGHRVTALKRGPARADAPTWDPSAGTIDLAPAGPMDAVIHLAGESIAAGRWTAARKARILESREAGTRLLVDALGRCDPVPHTLVSASAVGYYGSRGDAILDEGSSPGGDFLADVCVRWESAAQAATAHGVRVVLPRIGVVLSRQGGALPKMLPPFRLGFGGVIGDGSQYMSWVALDDLVAAFAFLLEDPALTGPVNCVSPRPVTNREFTRALGRVLKRPTVLPLPAFAARLLLGEMADALLLSSARVTPAKLTAAGFSFQQAELEGCLRSELS